MELQFQRNSFDCLRTVVREIKSEERTQEVKLPDAMPDIGKVLGAWGQPVIRSKDWRGDGMGVSGGVMVWILYLPEDGSVPRSVDTWIPFQMHWDFPQTERDGTITASCMLRNVDARLISARKLMTRVVVEVAGEALEPVQMYLFSPCELPEDVCLLRKSYPVCIPRESGEKTFLLDEELTLPGTCSDVQRVVQYSLHPELIDKKVMGDKIVFRGTALVHMLCRCNEGELKSCDFDVPFSQYADLSREYDSYATVNLVPEVTNLELDIQESGILRLKAGVVGQYVIYDRPVVEIIEDVYSPNRNITIHTEEWSAPVVLEQKQEHLKVEQSMEADGQQIVDISFLHGHPEVKREEMKMELEIPGAFQMLWYDEENNLQNSTTRWHGDASMPIDRNSIPVATCRRSGRIQGTLGGANALVRCDLNIDIITTSAASIPMVTGLELGELMPRDTYRPSLILRRADTESLWNVAKECGSTVEAIQQANGLTAEPEEGRILLIPVS